MDRKAAIRAAFSRAAATYDAVGAVQRGTSRELSRLIADSHSRRPFGSPRPNVLEIGCGTGGLTAELRRQFPAASLTALDFSAPMLALAQAKLNALDREVHSPAESEASGPPINWQLADGERFEPPPESNYDLIASSGALQWFDDLPAALERFRGWLAPGGRLAFALFGQGTFRELQDVWQAVGPTGKHVAASDFLSVAQVAKLIEPLFPHAQVQATLSQQTFGSLRELLVHCRTTGVGGTASGGGLITPGAIRRVERLYRERYGEITATYEVLVVLAERQDA